ncbi:MAG: hypothetical protein ACAI35_19600 [Candidatus Methylacidiphilales bacterium]
MVFSFFSQPTWCIIDCATGKATAVAQFPHVLGTGAGADHILSTYPELLPQHCALTQDKNRNVRLILKNPAAEIALNGGHTTYAELSPGQDYALQVPGHYFIIRGGEKSEIANWIRGFRHTEWTLYDNADGSSSPVLPLPALLSWAFAEGKSPMGCALFPTGSQSGFHLAQFPRSMAEQTQPASPRSAGPPPYPPAHVGGNSTNGNGAFQDSFAGNGASHPSTPRTQPPTPQPQPVAVDAGDTGEYTCPTCWLQFDAEDVMHVAMHDSLRGDPILGEDAPQRFHATSFNNRGQALDAMGIPCFDTACPHCRSKFPPSFLQSPHHIFSVVGNASAGKTYFLAVVAKTLPAVAYRHLGLTWQDADPGANASLNVMRDSLFGASSAEGAVLDKTQIGNATTYQSIPRHGKIVQMPKPFSFHIASRGGNNSEENATVIFYDNAGEHFRPDVRIEDHPGALHVATASAIFFLFDPINNTEFRQRLRGQADPQLENAITSDMQDVILSEIRSRIMRLGHLTLRQKSAKPLAVMVGKSDAWLHLLNPGDTLRPAVINGSLHLGNIRHNSAITRELLLDSSPAIVANAEALSSQVQFFPVSTFGHTPLRVKRENGVSAIAPDPALLRPHLVEAPILWALHQLSPELIPTTDEPAAAART